VRRPRSRRVNMALLATRRLPVLARPYSAACCCSFGSGFSAYATAEALTAGARSPLRPFQIGAILNGNVLFRAKQILGYALGFAMNRDLADLGHRIRTTSSKDVAMASLELGQAIQGEALMDFLLRAVTPRPAGSKRVRWGRGTALFLAALYFHRPFYAAMQFCLQDVNGHLHPSNIYANRASARFLLGSLALDAVGGRDDGDRTDPHGADDDLRAPSDASLSPSDGSHHHSADCHSSNRPDRRRRRGVTPLWLKSSQWLLALIYRGARNAYVYRSLDAGLARSTLRRS